MLKQRIAKKILQLAKWSVEINVDIPLPHKCVICVAPHTSNWDFILCELALKASGLQSGFLMKETWFFFPLGYVFRAMGGIAVPRKKGGELTRSIIETGKRSKNFVIALTPEGTRSYNEKWRKGFLHIAYGMDIPILLCYLDFKNKVVCLDREFKYTRDIENDLRQVKLYYKDIPAKYPDKFGTGL